MSGLSRAEKAQALDQLRQRILDDKVCSDLADQAIQLVMGDGNVDADIIFIGEAPGKNEDEQGVPFVGAAGKFLNEMLDSISLKREDVYITNIVKYRPPNNRDPLPAEKRAFWPYLVKQIEIIDPKIIVTLGRHSMGYFLPNAKISQIHGQPQQLDAVDGEHQYHWTILPLYHPAAALYNGSLRQTLMADFKQLASLT